MRSLAVGAWLLLVLVASPSVGNAQSVETAGALYDHAVEAQERGEYARAAALFARADELLPDPIALQAAIGAAVLANDAALAMSLVDRARRAPMPASLAGAVQKADERFGDRIGALVVRCRECTALVDGAPARVGQRVWLSVGAHRVDVASGGALTRHDVTIVARDTFELAADAAVAPPVPTAGPRPGTGDTTPPRGGPGPSPAWFWASAGLTLTVAGFAVASGVDTLAIHDDFHTRPSRALAAEGRSAETRTYVLWGVTGALGLATAVVGLVVVDWGGPKTSIAGGISPSGVHVTARF